MAISPINVSRISLNMRSDSVLSSLRRNQLEVFRTQTRVSTGRSFVTPSDDPVRAARALNLTQALSRQQQFIENLRHGDDTLAASDQSLTELNSLLIEASQIASQNVSNLTSAAEREAVADIVAGIRQQLQIVGNREFNGRFLFAGQNTTERPFIDALGGVAYVGDTRDLFTRTSPQLDATLNVPGSSLFRALSPPAATDADLIPALTSDTRLDAIRGATAQGFSEGLLILNEISGAGAITVDLTNVDTIGDVVTRINEAAGTAGSTLTASLTDTGLSIQPGSSAVSITDVSSGVIASNLGILTIEPTTDVVNGFSLEAKITPLTSVSSLGGGAANIDLASGMVITNGASTATVDLSNAETVQDILNRINNAGLFVWARINDDGSGIEVLNRVSGTSLSIGENGGTTALDLGIRTLSTATPLDQLNFGKGVTRADGLDDLRITAADGSSIDLNIDTVTTVGELIDLINQSATDAGVNVTATLATVGNGIRLTDQSGGPGTITVTSLNLSQAAEDLGLTNPTVAKADELVSRDSNPVRTDGVLDALFDLERALRKDDTQGITIAADRLNPFIQDVTRVHGIIGARSQALSAKRSQMIDAAAATEILLSDVQDLDFAEAITKMQAASTQLQAGLQTSSLLLNVSLLDFLR